MQVMHRRASALSRTAAGRGCPQLPTGTWKARAPVDLIVRPLAAPASCSSASSQQAEATSDPSHPIPASVTPVQAMQAHAKHAVRHMSAVAFPLASIALGTNAELFGALAKAMEIYMALLTVRVLLSWFRNIKWSSEPFNMVRQFTDPYLNLFRGVIPPIGGMDLSPMLGFFILSFATKQMKKLSYGALIN